MIFIARIADIDVVCGIGICSTKRYLAVNGDILRLACVGTVGVLHDNVLKLLRRISGVVVKSTLRCIGIRRIGIHSDRYACWCSGFNLVNMEAYRCGRRQSVTGSRESYLDDRGMRTCIKSCLGHNRPARTASRECELIRIGSR